MHIYECHVCEDFDEESCPLNSCTWIVSEVEGELDSCNGEIGNCEYDDYDGYDCYLLNKQKQQYNK